MIGRVRTLRLSVPTVQPVALVTVLALAVVTLLGYLLATEYWKTAALLFGACLAPLIIRWPVVGAFGVYAFFIPFDDLVTFSDGSTANRLLGIAATGALLAAGLVQRRLTRPPLPSLWLSLFVFWAAASAVWAIDPTIVFGRLQTMLSLFLLYLIAVSFRVSEQEFLGVCSLSILGAVAAGVVSWVFHREALYGEARRRSTVTIDESSADPNGVAAALLLPFALALTAAVTTRNVLARTAAFVATGVIAGTILLTMSRGGVLGLLVILLLILVRFRIRWQILLAIAGVIAIGAVMPEEFLARMLSVVEEDDTGSGRLPIWTIGLDMLKDYGIFGAGLSHFPALYERYLPAGPRGGPAAGSHNIYLGIWVELGTIGLALMLTAFATHFRHVARSHNRFVKPNVFAVAIQAACVAMLVASLFLDTLWKKFFWLPWILLCWAASLSKPIEAAPLRETSLPETRTAGRGADGEHV